MNEQHEANRRYWDERAIAWRALRDRDGLWRECPRQPQLAFEGEAFEQIQRFLPDLSGRRVCVMGSGDNYAAFALSGCGADVTSVDISQRQLDVGRDRAAVLGLDIDFVRADAAGGLPCGNYDLVVSTNGFFVWVSNPADVFAAVHDGLKPGGFYIFYDIHPFLRPWADQTSPLAMAKPYGDRGPYVYDGCDDVAKDGHDVRPGNHVGRCYEFHWTMGDLLKALAEANLVLKTVRETAAASSRFWQDFSFEPGTRDELLNWKQNPRAGLPAWLTVAAQKPRGDTASEPKPR